MCVCVSAVHGLETTRAHALHLRILRLVSQVTAGSAADAAKIDKAEARISARALKHYNDAILKSCDECFAAFTKGKARGCNPLCEDNMKSASMYFIQGCEDAPDRCKMAGLKGMCKCLPNVESATNGKNPGAGNDGDVQTTKSPDGADAAGSSDNSKLRKKPLDIIIVSVTRRHTCTSYH